MRKLGRKKSHRESMLRNLVTSLLLYEKVDTTEAKAKELKNWVELIITKAKKESPDSKRFVYAKLFDKNASKKLVEELIPRYKNRISGFVTILRLGTRPGDNSQMLRVELIDKKIFAVKTDIDSKNTEKTKIGKEKQIAEKGLINNKKMVKK